LAYRNEPVNPRLIKTSNQTQQYSLLNQLFQTPRLQLVLQKLIVQSPYASKTLSSPSHSGNQGHKYRDSPPGAPCRTTSRCPACCRFMGKDGIGRERFEHVLGVHGREPRIRRRGREIQHRRPGHLVRQHHRGPVHVASAKSRGPRRLVGSKTCARRVAGLAARVPGACGFRLALEVAFEVRNTVQASA
jgi:hypothetical protein